MIPEQAIVEWRREAPWDANSLVEQDLIISRALVEMYSVPEIAQRLAFRGGTALYKLHLRPAARYSEDIDLPATVATYALVQTRICVTPKPSHSLTGLVEVSTKPLCPGRSTWATVTSPTCS